MSHFFTTELGRIRTDEAIARADRYRLAQQAQQHKERNTLSRPSRFVYRRALAAVGLSALVVIGTATAALAYPAGPGTSTGSDIVADRIHPQVKGVRLGVPDGTLASTFAQAREGTASETDLALPRRAEHVFQPQDRSVTFAGVREGTVPEVDVAAGTFAQAREGTPEPVAVAVPSEGERFAGSGLYADRTPYVALGNRHNADALAQMVDGPSDVADAAVQAPVEDAGTSLSTIVAIASLLLLVGGGVMVAARDRDMPKPV
jgi:hypothetical protein